MRPGWSFLSFFPLILNLASGNSTFACGLTIANRLYARCQPKYASSFDLAYDTYDAYLFMCFLFLVADHVYKAIDALPESAHPMTQFATGVMALQVDYSKTYSVV